MAMMRGKPVQRPVQCDPWERLVIAVLAQAAKDLRQQSRQRLRNEALVWLNTHEVRELAKDFGIHIPAVQTLQGVTRGATKR